MRISFVLSSLRLSGGVRVVVEFANRLSARGHQCFLVAPTNRIDPDMRAEVQSSVTLNQSAIAPGEHRSVLGQFLLSWSLAKCVPASDVILSTHTPTTVATLLASRILRRGKPVWLYQDYLEMFLDRPFEKWLLRHALAWHDRALAVSQYSQAELASYGSTDVVLVGEGLSHAELLHPLPRTQREFDQEKRAVLTLADMRPRKGLHDFLTACDVVLEKVPDLISWVVTKDKLEIQCSAPVRCFHRPSRKKLAELYATCDVFVSASWWESFGLPPLEAMACGAPVVTTDSRGIREYARSGWNCLITPPRDPGALARAVIEILTNQDLSERLRQNGPPTAVNYSWDSAVHRFEAAVKDLF